MEYPVVKMESFILSDASATPLYWHRILHREIDTAGMCGCSQRVFGVFLADGGEGHQGLGGDVAAVPVWGLSIIKHN